MTIVKTVKEVVAKQLKSTRPHVTVRGNEVTYADDLSKWIHLRRSVSHESGGLLPDPIDKKDVETILEAAHWAPNHGRTEPWRFVVFTGEGRKELGEIFAASYKVGYHLSPKNKVYSAEREEFMRDQVWNVPVWISLGMQPDPNRPEWEELAAVSCAVQNAWLTATSLGLNTFWASGVAATHENTARALGLEPPGKVLGFLYLAKHKGKQPKGSRTSWRKKVVWKE